MAALTQLSPKSFALFIAIRSEGISAELIFLTACQFFTKSSFPEPLAPTWEIASNRSSLVHARWLVMLKINNNINLDIFASKPFPFEFTKKKFLIFFLSFISLFLNIRSMNFFKIPSFLILALCQHLFSEKSDPMRLWPGLAPGEVEGEVDKEQYRKPKPGSKDVLRIANVAVPTITIYSAKPSISNGTAVIVCPGVDIIFWLMSMKGLRFVIG